MPYCWVLLARLFDAAAEDRQILLGECPLGTFRARLNCVRMKMSPVEAGIVPQVGADYLCRPAITAKVHFQECLERSGNKHVAVLFACSLRRRNVRLL